MSRFGRWLLVTATIAILVASAMYYAFRPHRTNKFYQYASATASTDDYTIDASLHGTFYSERHLTVYTSPYELMLSIVFHDGSQHPIQVTGVEIVDAMNNTVVFGTEDSFEAETQMDPDGKYWTYASSPKLELEYRDYVVIIMVQAKLADRIEEREFKLRLEKRYREHRSNDIVDMIMSG